jgi:hypothetical protein
VQKSKHKATLSISPSISPFLSHPFYLTLSISPFLSHPFYLTLSISCYANEGEIEGEEASNCAEIEAQLASYLSAVGFLSMLAYLCHPFYL